MPAHHDATTPALVLTKNIAGHILAGHPWVYRDALRPQETWPIASAVCDLIDRDGRFVARGLYATGPIAFRVLTLKRETLDAGFVRKRIRWARQLRERVLDPNTNAYRWIYGENDELPGIVVDVYDDVAVIKTDGGFADVLLPHVVAALVEEGPIRGRSDRALGSTGFRAIVHRKGRGSEKESEVLHGVLPAGPIVVLEHGMKLWADVILGQKSGLFLDHRESRLWVRKLSRGLDCLNLYGYTGGFSVAAGLGGAKSVETVDVAKDALALAVRSFDENALKMHHLATVSDVPDFLQKARTHKRQWDLVVADPPSFAPSEAAKGNAISSYRKLHRAALACVRDRGFYLAASCSSHVDREAFLQTIEEGAEKAGVRLKRLALWAAAPDHPVLYPFVESDYLKSFLFQVLR